MEIFFLFFPSTTILSACSQNGLSSYTPSFHRSVRGQKKQNKKAEKRKVVDSYIFSRIVRLEVHHVLSE